MTVDGSAPSAEAFDDSTAHLLGELERVDLLLRRQVARLRERYPAGAPPMGLHIPDGEVEALLARPAEPGDRDGGAFEAALDALSGRIAARAAESRRRGIALRLDRLIDAFDLDALDRDILLIALAPEIDGRYGRVYAYLQDDATRQRPGVELAFALLQAGPAAMVEARRRLSPDAPLRRCRLLDVVEDAGQPGAPLPGQGLRTGAAVVDHLLGVDHLDPSIAGWVRIVEASRDLGDLMLPPDAAERLAALKRSGLPDGGLVMHLRGPEGSGRGSTVEAVAAAFGFACLAVDGVRAAALAEADFGAGLAVIRREAILRRAAVCWEGVDALLDDGRRPALRALLDLPCDGVALLGLCGERDWVPRGGVPPVPCLSLHLTCPGAGDRLALWRRALAGCAGAPAGADLAALADAFRFTGGQIQDAAATALDHARWCRGGNAPDLADLQGACRRRSSRSLTALGQKIEPRHGWADLVLPADRMRQLREIVDGMRYRALVHEDWGFGAKLSLGKGLAALFAGPSGTGKTMAAEVIARELARDLYKVDLSSVVSKYIGETEKNLSRIFAEAEAGNAILFFDEADALFGKRSEVRDAHDRYANIETAYLLQRLEAHEGVVILATNLKKNMDDAFVRRLQATIEFPVPTESDRRRIWSSIWPDAMPLGEDLDQAALARLELSGGHIKNVALASAYLAASRGEVVGMAHVLQAARRELQKMGGLTAGAQLVGAGHS